MIKKKHVFIIVALFMAGTAFFIFSKESGNTRQDTVGGSSVAAAKNPAEYPSERQKREPSTSAARNSSGDSRHGDIDQPPDMSERMRIAMELRNNFSRDSVLKLASFLDDTEASVAQEALDSLGYIGLNSDLKQMILDILIKKSMDDGYFHRGAALLTAASLDDGKQVLPVIEMYASSDDEEVSTYAIRAMSLLHSEDSVSIIADMLGNLRSPDDIRTAFAVLARINTPEAAAILEKNLYSREQVLQEQCVWALSIAKSGNHVEYLVKAITSDSLTPQSLAVLAESQAGPAVFGSILQREDMPADKIIKLLEIMEEHAMLAPGSTRSETAEIIGSLFDSPNPDLQIAAIRTLGKIGAPLDKSSLLIPKLQSDNTQIQMEALSAFVQYCTPDTYKPLLDLFWHEDQKIRRSAFLISSPFLNSSDRAVLEEALQHNDPYIGEQARLTLEKISQ